MPNAGPREPIAVAPPMSDALVRVVLVLAAAVALAVAGCSSIAGPPPPPLTVPQVIALSQTVDDPEVIIQRIRESRTVYRLTAGQVADLESRGVPRLVAEYMRQTYIDAVQREQIREDWSYWTFDGGYWYGGCAYGWNSPWCDA